MPTLIPFSCQSPLTHINFIFSNLLLYYHLRLLHHCSLLLHILTRNCCTLTIRIFHINIWSYIINIDSQLRSNTHFTHSFLLDWCNIVHWENEWIIIKLETLSLQAIVTEECNEIRLQYIKRIVIYDLDKCSTLTLTRIDESSEWGFTFDSYSNSKWRWILFFLNLFLLLLILLLLLLLLLLSFVMPEKFS